MSLTSYYIESYALKWLKKASDELDKAVAGLSNVFLTKQWKNRKPVSKPAKFTTSLAGIHGLKKEYENTFALKLKLRHKIISPQRAMAMAKNIFVHGEFKRLREEYVNTKKPSKDSPKNFLLMLRKKKHSKGEIGKFYRIRLCKLSII